MRHALPSVVKLALEHNLDSVSQLFADRDNHFGWMFKPGIPLDFAVGQIAAHRAVAALHALGYAIQHRKPIEERRAWLLAQETASGFWEVLRLHASVNGTMVPFDVVAEQDRYDLPALFEAARRNEEDLAVLAAKKPAGVEVWFPDGGPDNTGA